MKQTEYIIKPVMMEGGNTIKWRASYKKREDATRGFTTITDVDFVFDTEAEANEFARALLIKEGVNEEQIIKE